MMLKLGRFEPDTDSVFGEDDAKHRKDSYDSFINKRTFLCSHWFDNSTFNLVLPIADPMHMLCSKFNIFRRIYYTKYVYTYIFNG